MNRTPLYNSLAQRADWPSDRHDAMTAVIDALWDALSPTGVSWIGFYLEQPDAPHDQRLVLGPRRDKPACSPIGTHGVCGQSYLAKVTRIVRDVKDLGEDYIACDPRDQSEIVVPLLEAAGRCWAVLDVDSWDVGSFDESDDEGLRLVLGSAGLM